MTSFLDVADHDEDCRIRQIGEAVMQQQLTVAFITDDEPDKPERYIRKLQERFPGIRVIQRFAGPVKNTVMGADSMTIPYMPVKAGTEAKLS